MKLRFSISLRLTIWFSAIFLIGFLLFGGALYADLAYSLGAGRDKTISNRAKRLEELLQNTLSDPHERRVAKFVDFTEATPEGNLIQVFDSHGTRVLPPASWPATVFPWPSEATFETSRRFSTCGYSGRPYRVLAQTITSGDMQYRVLVAGQLQDNRTMLSRFAHALLWATPALLVASAFLGYFVSRRALDPVARLTASARSITAGNLQRRLPISDTGDELQKLAETCNDMLARVESSVQQITRFTADASHELRSPIAYIKTISEYALRDPDLDREAAESFREIVRESDEATHLLEDMLTLARADSRHAGIDFGPVDLSQVVAETYRRAQPFADARHHELSLCLEEKGAVPIAGDLPTLRRLLWILVDNAIRYTPESGSICLGLQIAGTEARVFVQDSGPGIPEPELVHIFDRFHRVERDRQTGDGTGLGLAIAKWIAEIHRAELSVRSTQGKGSTFEAAFNLLV
jgi:heavy metal sensor kinase